MSGEFPPLPLAGEGWGKGVEQGKAADLTPARSLREREPGK